MPKELSAIVKSRRAVLAVVALLVLAGCGRDDSTSATTSAPTEAAPTTSITVAEVEGAGADDSGAQMPDEPGTLPSDGESSAQTEPEADLPPPIPPYEIVHRLIVDDRTTLVILVEPGAYSTVQLENLVYDVVDTHSPNTAVVVDDRSAADLAIMEDLTAEEQSTLDARTFLRIENGVDVTFHGPYADAGGMTVGS